MGRARRATGSNSLTASMSFLPDTWCVLRNPRQPGVRSGRHAEGQDVSGAIPRTDGSAFPGQSFVLDQVLYIHMLPVARAILDIHAGCSCAHVTSWAKLCYRGKSKVFVYPSQWKSLVFVSTLKEGVCQSDRTVNSGCWQTKDQHLAPAVQDHHEAWKSKMQRASGSFSALSKEGEKQELWGRDRNGSRSEISSVRRGCSAVHGGPVLECRVDLSRRSSGVYSLGRGVQLRR